METGNCLKRVDRPHTLEEIGVALGGITKERVRQIEEVAYKKIKWRAGKVLEEFYKD